MKKINILAAALLSMMAFTSCGSDEDDSNVLESSAIRFDLSVGDTRASHADASHISTLGVLYGSKDFAEYYTVNEKLDVVDGAINTYPQSMYWRNYTDDFSFVVYSPHTAACDDNKNLSVAVEKEQTAESYQSDFLCQNFTTNYASSNAGKIDVRLDHKFTELNVNVIIGDDFSTEPAGMLVSNVIVRGTDTEGQYSLTDGSITTSAPADIVPYHVSAEGSRCTYRCIVLPQTVEQDLSVTLKIKSKGTVKWTSPSAVTFNGGERINLNLKVGRDKVVLGSVTAEPWVQNNIEDPWHTN